MNVLGFVSHPVIAQLFGAEDKNAQIAVLVVFDDGQRRERFAQTDAVRQNAAVELFQFADDGKNSVFLKGVQLVPDDALLEAVCFIGKVVLADVFEKVTKNIVQREKVEELRTVFLVGGSDVFQHRVGDILQSLFVVPNRVEQFQIAFAFRGVHTVDHGEQIAAALTAQVRAGKAVDRGIGHRGAAVDRHKVGDSVCRLVGFEADLAANPVGALAGDGFLGEIVAQTYLKFAAVQSLFTVAAGNVELPPRLGRLILQKSRGSEKKAQFVDVFQLGFQLLIRVDGKTGRRNGNTAVALHRHAQVVHQFVAQVVDEFHMGHLAEKKC